MFGVVVALDGQLIASPEGQRVLTTLAECSVRYVVLSNVSGNGELATLVDRLDLPARCIWYLTDRNATSVEAALSSGFNVVWVGRAPASGGPANISLHVVASLSEALDVLCEPYTRSALALRYLLTFPNDE